MGTFEEEGTIREVTYGENFAYILSINKMFAAEEFATLYNDVSDIFVRCEQREESGQVQLLYLTAGLRSLASVIPYMMPDMFYEDVQKIYQGIAKVRQHLILQGKNLDISLDHIYIDPKNGGIRLVYVPLAEGFYYDDADMEADFREMIAHSVSKYGTLASPQNTTLVSGLQETNTPLAEIFNDHFMMEQPSETAMSDHMKAGLRLISVNTSEEIVLNVDRDEYVIGRSAQRADGIIPNNRTVGRAHCMITYSEEGYFVEDLDSTNGTWLNNTELTAGTKARLRNGDLLEVADVEMQVVIEGEQPMSEPPVPMQDEMMQMSFESMQNETKAEKKQTQLILVTSAVGGVGKTTTAMGIAAELSQNGREVLYINVDYLQNFQYLLENETAIYADEVYSRLLADENTAYQSVKPMIRKEMFDYIPPFKESLLSLGLHHGIGVQIAKQAAQEGEYDYVILDMDSTFDSEKTEMMNSADRIVLVITVEENVLYSTRRMLDHLRLQESDRQIIVLNRFENNEEAAVDAAARYAITIDEGIEMLDHYSEMKNLKFSSGMGIRSVASRIDQR